MADDDNRRQIIRQLEDRMARESQAAQNNPDPNSDIGQGFRRKMQRDAEAAMILRHNDPPAQPVERRRKLTHKRRY